MNNEKASVNEQEPVSKGSYIMSVVRLGVVFIVLCGIIYPLVTTAIAQAFMPFQANGSLLKNDDGKVIGSELIGQNFTNPALFHGRVSSIQYKAEASGSNNYGPSNPDMLQRTSDSVSEWKINNPDVPINELPVDLVTNSGSGLDPHISSAAAKVQIPRISNLTGIPANVLEGLVEKNTESRDLGLFGEERVNVLKLNMVLSEMQAE